MRFQWNTAADINEYPVPLSLWDMKAYTHPCDDAVKCMKTDN